MPIVNTALTLNDLPPPPPGKTGWPWTEENKSLPAQMPDGSEWPQISIVTPSYNYGRFIEETIRSVLLQGYPNLEYIIIDGGSTDTTVEIIKKYEQYITYWVSEPDKGQTDAINKGYQRCTGDIFAWLNADDAYATSTCFQDVAEIYRSGYKLIAGELLPIDAEGNELSDYRYFGKSIPANFYQYLKFWSCRHLPQPAVFVATALADKSFPLDESIKMAMDYQLFLRVLSQNPSAVWLDKIWVNFKYHGTNKTMKNYTQGFDELSELKSIVLAESEKLPLLMKKYFQFTVKDFSKIYPLIYSDNSVKSSNFIDSLRQRPSIARWPIFWKVFAKKLLNFQYKRNFKNES